MNKQEIHPYLDKACRLVGGQAALARILKVKPPTVNQWLKLEKPIPARHCPNIERAVMGAVICEQLLPDVDWGYLRTSRSSHAPTQQEQP